MIPTDASGITAGWLEPFLGPVDDVLVAPIGEGFGFGGTTFRVDHTSGSVVVKLATAERTLRERAFYQQVAPTTPIPAIGFLGAEVDGDNGVLILEYLDGARQGDVLEGCTPGEMAGLAGQLGTLHGRWWEATEPLDGLGPRPRMQLTPDRLETALERHPPPSHLLDRMIDLPDRVEAIYERFDRQPTTVSHRDFHLDNVLFSTEPMIIDWQLAAAGPPAVDIARLLIEVRPLDVTVDAAASAIDRYLAELPDAVRPSHSTLLDWMEPAFDLALAGFANWLGSPDAVTDGRMAALQAQGFPSVATGIDLADRLRLVFQ